MSSAPEAAFVATIAPRNEQSEGAAVQALAIAGSGSSFLSTVKVVAWAGLATSSRHKAMIAAAKKPTVATTVLLLLLISRARHMCIFRVRLALLACSTSSGWRS